MRQISTPQGIRYVDVEDRGAIHRYLLQYAADLANSSPDLPMPLKRRGIRPLREANYLTGEDLLTLEIVEGSLAGLPARIRKKVEKQLNEIATRSFHQAVLENQSLFVGMVIGEARKGRDYFESFAEVTDE